jgi:putative ABC transport system permease protein
VADTIRTSARALWRSRAFSLTAVVSVALGVTLAAAVGAVANAYLVRSLPFDHADRLYHISYAEPRQPEPRGARLIDWAALGNVIELADSTGVARLFLLGEPGLQEVQGIRTLPRSAQGIRFGVAAGRSFVESDFAPGAPTTMLISRRLWFGRYNGDSSVIGRSVLLAPAGGFAEATSVRIIGVVDRPVRDVLTFERGEVDIIFPLRESATVYLVRTRPGVTGAIAEREINQAFRSVATAIPAGWHGVRLESVNDRYVAPVRPVLLGLSIAVGLVLAIVLANVSVLSLLRRVRREKELAVRRALGASNARIASLALTEGAIIAGAGAVLATAATWLILGALGPLIEQRLGRAPSGGAGAIVIDSAVWLVIIGVLALSLVALTLPALGRGEGGLVDALRRVGLAGADGPRARNARSVLIAAEVAISVVLLASTGMMIGRVGNLLDTDLGIDPRGVVRARVSVPARAYATDSARSRFYSRLEAAVTASRGGGFALSSGTPFYEPDHTSLERGEGRTPSGIRPAAISVTEGYFGIVGIRVTRGRNFGRRDALGAAPVAIISEGLAKRLWPGEDPVGRSLRTRATNAATDTSVAPWRTVVGVVSDVRQGFDDTNLADLYFPFAQAPTQYAQFMARGRGADSAVAAVRRAAMASDPEAMVTLPTRLDDEIGQMLAGPQFILSLLAGFAAAAMLVAGIGLYGVTAYAVTQRERELAIRLALGATVGAVVRLFVFDGGRLVLAGVIVGLAGTAAAGRVLAGQLHGVKWFDLGATSGAVAVIVLAAAAAIWWPARRSAAVSPAATLKEA